MANKFSFSISSKSSSSKPNRNTLNNSDSSADNEAPPNDDNSSHHYITEFDSTYQTPNGASSRTQKWVIPPLENEYRPGKLMKNLDPPLRSAGTGAGPNGELSFEVDLTADLAGEGPGAKMSYGLNVRRSGKENGAGYRFSDDRRGKEPIEVVLLKQLKDDVARLPEDEGFEQFEEVPVEGFGAALMAGYGWKEGMGIGRNAKRDVEVLKYKRWVGRQGIGASAYVDGNGKKADNGVAGRRRRGRKREKEGGRVGKRESSVFLVGKEVRIIGGRHVGLKGRVVEDSSGDGSLVLELPRSKEQVRVFVTEVVELGSAEDEKCLKKLQELKLQDSKADNGRAGKKERVSTAIRSHKERNEGKRSREERRKDYGGYVKRDSMKREEERVCRVSWLRSHIRVRIISKEFRGGRLYLKKGHVLDVVGPTTCDISIDDNREIIQGVEQDILETALPKRGGTVIVLVGKHKGAYGSLVKRDPETESGVVQDADTHELLNVRLEQIAEYVGDPSYVGY